MTDEHGAMIEWLFLPENESNLHRQFVQHESHIKSSGMNKIPCGEKPAPIILTIFLGNTDEKFISIMFQYIIVTIFLYLRRISQDFTRTNRPLQCPEASSFRPCPKPS